MARLLAILTAVALLTHEASAQQRLFVIVNAADRLSHAVWEGHIENGSVTAARMRGVAPGQGADPTTADGGQFVLWNASLSGNVVHALDRSTGAVLDVPGQCPHVVDPTRARLFTCVNNSIVAITPGGFAEVPGTAGLIPKAVSADGSVVFARRTTRVLPPELFDLVGIHADTGAIVGSFPVGTLPTDVAPAQNGTTVWVISARPEAPYQPLLRGFGWPSGQVLITQTLAPSNPYFTTVSHRIVGVDSARQRLVLATTTMSTRASEFATTVNVLDSESGSRIGGGSLDGPGPAGLDRGAGEILGISQSAFLTPPDRPWLTRFSAETGEELSRKPLEVTTWLGETAFAMPPPPPTLSPAVVSPARSVALSWIRAPEQVTGFIVEAGSAPGRSDLAVLPVTTGETLTVPNVPSGTYYVRVRAQNHVGPGLPSNEIAVVVQ